MYMHVTVILTRTYFYLKFQQKGMVLLNILVEKSPFVFLQ